jgi:large subunit ribosomal protein L32
MIVQQRRCSKGRRGMRRSHDHLELTGTCVCKKCGKQIKPHRVCQYCGYYDNKKIVEVK